MNMELWNILLNLATIYCIVVILSGFGAGLYLFWGKPNMAVPWGILIPWLLFLSWLVKDIRYEFREIYIYFLTFYLIFCCLLSSLGANLLDYKLESIRKISLYRKIVLKFLLIIVAGLSWATMTSLIKASAMQYGLAKYNEDDRLIAVANQEAKKDADIIKNRIEDCKIFSNDLAKIKSKELKGKAGFWRQIFGDVELKSKNDMGLGFSVYFDETLTNYGSVYDFYSQVGDSKLCNVRIPGKELRRIDSSEDVVSIPIQVLKNYVNLTIEKDEDLLVSTIKHPFNLRTFALASMLSSLGVLRFSLEPEKGHEFTERLDFLVMWAGYIYALIIVVIMSVLGRKKALKDISS